MRGRFEHQFPECVDCRFYVPGRASAKCRRCGAGEFFEELLRELHPEIDTTLKARTSRFRDDDDE